MTFHAPYANPVNYKVSSKPLVYVESGALVTLYANINQGMYLSTQDMRFSVSPEHFHRDASLNNQCEFKVHRKETRRVSSSSVDDKDYMVFGDVVCLELTSSLGHFLAILRDNTLGLVTHPIFFELCVIKLRDLVKLKAHMHTDTKSDSPRGTHTDPFMAMRTPEEGRLEETKAMRTPEEGRLEETKAMRTPEEGRLEETKAIEASMAKLPLELIMQILSYKEGYLLACRGVCKMWRKVADSQVYSVRVNGEFSELSSEAELFELVDFVSRCVNLRKLTFRNVDLLKDEHIQKLLRRSHATNRDDLRALSLGGCRLLTDGGVRAMGWLPGLKELNLASTDISDASLTSIAENCPNLRILNVYACQGVSADGFVALASKLDKLSSINIRGTNLNKHALLTIRTECSKKVEILSGPLKPDSIY